MLGYGKSAFGKTQGVRRSPDNSGIIRPGAFGAVTWLEMGWCGVVHVPPYAVGGEIGRKLVASVGVDYELVEHAIVGHKRQANIGMADFFAIDAGDGAPHGVFLGGVRQLHVEHGRLHRIEATVEACVDVVVTPVGAVVGERAYCSSQFRVGGGYGASVAHAADVFGRIEAERGGVAEGASGSRAVQSVVGRDCPDGLGVVLD